MTQPLLRIQYQIECLEWESLSIECLVEGEIKDEGLRVLPGRSGRRGVPGRR